MCLQGITGSELQSVLNRALTDYKRGARVETPSQSACDNWVISRTAPRQGGPFCVRWTLATRIATEQAPRKCPALANSYHTFWAARNYHPSLHDLTTMCNIICRGEKVT